MTPYKIEIDQINKEDWDCLITQFADATIYQTWSFGSLADKGRRISHIILKNDDNILGCCQVSLRHLPVLSAAIADVKWGPLCTKKNSEFNNEIFCHLIHVIKEEYAIKRGYMLRIWPHVIGEKKEFVRTFLEAEGFKKNMSERPYRTFMVDLTPTLVDIRKNFLQKWRNCLNKAEKNELNITVGTTDELFSLFINLAKEMVIRKNLTQEHISSFESYRRIQKDLPAQLKMKIMVCEEAKEPVCATVCSAVGDTGIYLLGATGEKALKLSASYALQWRMIQWMKDIGVKKYDLGAFNPQRNPGVYHFKAGIAGKKEWEETFIGEYHGYFNLKGRLTRLLFVLATKLRGSLNKQ
jgi:lipid II:glycine glycyltransferase (peptidoglycan interpeptide bridge formation enzyme)